MNLQELRQKKKWSLAQAAKRLGVPTSTYREWEAGRRIPAEALLKLSSVFGVSVSNLLGQVDERSEKLKKSVYYLEAALELVREALV